MKIRIQIPDHLRSNDAADDRQIFIDDIVLWGWETGMDIEYYGIHVPQSAWDYRNPDRRSWAVFSIETDSAFMFMLKWGATFHKDQKEVF